MDIFDMVRDNKIESEAPLARRMRPKVLDEIVGQEDILSKGKLLYRAIQADKLGSLILHGPPGTGKTTIARVIASTTAAHFSQLNASNSGKEEILDVVKEAQTRLGMKGQKTILFIDEIHRFSKLQQDALLPHVEDGILILIGATTENPYFEVNDALISRSRVFELKPLSAEVIKHLLLRAIKEDVVLKRNRIEVEEEALNFWADLSNGDARMALNALELGAMTTDKINGVIGINLKTAEECIQKRAIRYDKSGENHYDTISAYILSVRGSDPDAALYYMMRMLEGGEDPKFIARRLIVCASEEVGNADPNALTVAMTAANIVSFVGMPECQYALSQATIYVSCAPKSDAVFKAALLAKEAVRRKSILSIPPPIKDFLNGHAHKLGKGIGYKNAHDFDNHFVKQQYLPDELVGEIYYEPGTLGYEKTIKKWMTYLKG